MSELLPSDPDVPNFLFGANTTAHDIDFVILVLEAVRDLRAASRDFMPPDMLIEQQLAKPEDSCL